MPGLDPGISLQRREIAGLGREAHMSPAMTDEGMKVLS